MPKVPLPQKRNFLFEGKFILFLRCLDFYVFHESINFKIYTAQSENSVFIFSRECYLVAR